MIKQTGRATLIGAGALLFWVVEPLVVAELDGFPLFEALTLVFLTSFLFTSAIATWTKRWPVILKQPLFVWLFGCLAICGSDFCYVLGGLSAPIAHIDLIDYAWPMLLVVVLGFIPGEEFKWRHVIGALLSFVGIAQLVNFGPGAALAFSSNLPGYLLAIVGVLIWGAYSLFSRYNKFDTPVEMIGIYCGFGALFTLAAHLRLEQTVMPTQGQLCCAILVGLAGPGLSYQLWDFGMKHGNARVLGFGCYFSRIMSTSLLVWFGKEPFSKTLVSACCLSCFGAVISGFDYRACSVWLRNFFKKCKLFLASNSL